MSPLPSISHLLPSSLDWLDLSMHHSAAEKTCEMICYLWFSTPRPSSTLQLVASPLFVNFLRKILETTQISESVVVLSLHYIYRLKEKNGCTSAQPGSEFRIAVAALMMANKFLDDNTYTNKTWSEVSGIALSEINKMEREFLYGVDFRLFVGTGTYESWLHLLKGLVMAKERDSQWWWRRSTAHVPRATHLKLPPPTSFRAQHFQAPQPFPQLSQQHLPLQSDGYKHRARSSSPGHLPPPPSGPITAGPVDDVKPTASIVSPQGPPPLPPLRHLPIPVSAPLPAISQHRRRRSAEAHPEAPVPSLKRNASMAFSPHPPSSSSPSSTSSTSSSSSLASSFSSFSSVPMNGEGPPPNKRPLSTMLSLDIPPARSGPPSAGVVGMEVEEWRSFEKMSLGEPTAASVGQQTLVSTYKFDESRGRRGPQNLYYYTVAGSPPVREDDELEETEETEGDQGRRHTRKGRLQYATTAPPAPAPRAPSPPAPCSCCYLAAPAGRGIRSARSSPHRGHKERERGRVISTPPYAPASRARAVVPCGALANVVGMAGGMRMCAPGPGVGFGAGGVVEPRWNNWGVGV